MSNNQKGKLVRPGTIHIRAMQDVDGQEACVGYWRFESEDVQGLAESLARLHILLKADGDALLPLVSSLSLGMGALQDALPEPGDELPDPTGVLELDGVDDALDEAAAEAALYKVHRVLDLTELEPSKPAIRGPAQLGPTRATPAPRREPTPAAPQAAPPLVGDDDRTVVDPEDMVEDTAAGRADLADEVPRERVQAMVSNSLLIDNLRSVSVPADDKRHLAVEIIRVVGPRIVDVEYLLRGAEYELAVASTRIAKLTLDGDLTTFVPAGATATLYRAGVGGSQVRLNGGPRGCTQKVAPCEVLELSDVPGSPQQRWLLRQVPPEASLEPAKAPILATVFEEGTYWEETSADATH